MQKWPLPLQHNFTFILSCFNLEIDFCFIYFNNWNINCTLSASIASLSINVTSIILLNVSVVIAVADSCNDVKWFAIYVYMYVSIYKRIEIYVVLCRRALQPDWQLLKLQLRQRCKHPLPYPNANPKRIRNQNRIQNVSVLLTWASFRMLSRGRKGVRA